MEVKLFDSERKIMELLWERDDLSAKDLANALAAQVGWSKTTTYTVIKKCVDKGAITRTDPGFLCHAVISRDQAREYETNELIDKMYGGSADKLVASLLDSRKLSGDEISRLKDLIKELE